MKKNIETCESRDD